MSNKGDPTISDEEGDIDIHTGCEEPWSIEIPEDGEAVDEDEEKCPKNAPVSKVRLQTAVIGILFQIESLYYHSSSYKSI